MEQPAPRGGPSLESQPKGADGAQRRRVTWKRWALLACAALALLASITRIAADLQTLRWNPARFGMAAAIAFTSMIALSYLVYHHGLLDSTIRGRLLVAFVALSLLSVMGASVASIAVGYITGVRQASANLESLAREREVRIRTWCDALASELRAALVGEYSKNWARVSLELAERDVYYAFYADAMRSRLQGLASQSLQAQEFYLVDNAGTTVLSSSPTVEGAPATWRSRGSSEGPFPGYQLPYCAADGAAALVIAELGINDRDGRQLGTFAAAASPDGLYGVLGDQIGLGESGKAFLVSSAGRLLARPDDVWLAGPSCSEQADMGAYVDGTADPSMAGQGSGSVYTDYRGVRVVGAALDLPRLDATLVVEQDLEEALGSVLYTFGVTVAVALVLVVLAVMTSLFVTRSITTPLVHLSQTAARITAGDLSCEAVAPRDDEVGSLAIAFNTMTAQLRELIGQLEERVAERTHELQDRAIQLETCATVSREITSILTIDDLLGSVVERIREAFKCYHVEVLLVVDGHNSLESRAVSGPVNCRGRRVSIDDSSLNSRAVCSREAVLIDDFERDDDLIPDPSLPETRCELVIPLRVAGQVIGTLDAQSRRPRAFGEQEARVIQGLGDQIAIAIQNARLYERSRDLAVVEERNRLVRELHDSVTQSIYSLVLFAEAARTSFRDGQTQDLERQLADMGETAQQALREMRLQLYQLRPLELEREGLVAALQRRLDTVERRSGIDFALNLQDHPQLSPALQDALYGIALEALNNVAKHSGATMGNIDLRSHGQYMVAEINDNGKGFDPTTAGASGGMGLATMRERAEAVGGGLTVSSQPGQGTKVVVWIPAADNPGSRAV